MLRDGLAIQKNDEVGDGLNAESCRQLRMCFGVYFQDNSLTSHLARQLLHFGSRHSARPAPGCPEIDQNGNL